MLVRAFAATGLIRTLHDNAASENASRFFIATGTERVCTRMPSGMFSRLAKFRARNPGRRAEYRIRSNGGSSSVGRASASQAEGRGFESRFPLGKTIWRRAQRRPSLPRIPPTRSGRLAQLVQSACLTSRRSLVRIQYRPPEQPCFRHVYRVPALTSCAKNSRMPPYRARSRQLLAGGAGGDLFFIDGAARAGPTLEVTGSSMLVYGRSSAKIGLP